jgi:hypothetical protein
VPTPPEWGAPRGARAANFGAVANLVTVRKGAQFPAICVDRQRKDLLAIPDRSDPRAPQIDLEGSASVYNLCKLRLGAGPVGQCRGMAAVVVRAKSLGAGG